MSAEMLLKAGVPERWHHYVDPASIEQPEQWRCAICGFIVDLNYKATKPTLDFTMAGRSSRNKEKPDADHT